MFLTERKIELKRTLKPLRGEKRAKTPVVRRYWNTEMSTTALGNGPCEPCEKMHLKSVAKGRRFKKEPPLHPNCRCTVVETALLEAGPGEPWQLPSTRLDASTVGPLVPNATAPTTEPRWIQVARAGVFRGYSTPDGLGLVLDERAFDEMIANVHRHPWFRAGADGKGTADVVPFDFHHESEIQGGARATLGAPAVAWALDLEKRTGTDGTLELWALTRYLEPARSYVLEGKFRSCSIAAIRDAKDPVTAERQGWTLTSIAFTNNPFIQGMAPIQASAEWYGPPPETPADAVDGLRDMFELSELAGTDDIRKMMGRLASYIAAPRTAPTGSQPAKLMGALRKMLGLPLMTDDGEVFAQVDKLLKDVEAAKAAADAEAAGTSPPPAPVTTSRNHMALPKLLIALAGIYGSTFAAGATEEDQERKILADASEAAKRRDEFCKMAKAFGLSDNASPDEIGAKAKEIMANHAALSGLMPSIASMADAEEKDASEDTEKAMASRRIPKEDMAMRGALLNSRTGGVAFDRTPSGTIDAASPSLAARFAKRVEAKRAFLSQHPALATAPQHEHLLQPIMTPTPTSSPGAVLGGNAPSTGPLYYMDSAGRMCMRQATAPAFAPGDQRVHATADGAHRDDPDLKINLSSIAAPNYVMRAITYFKAQPGGAMLSHEQATDMAIALVRKQRAAGIIAQGDYGVAPVLMA